MKYIFFKIQTQHLQNVGKLKEPIYKKEEHLVKKIRRFY